MNLAKNPVVNELVPSEFYLGQNYPNPFNDKTTIKYCLAYRTNVLITVFNSAGELVGKLVDEEKKAGTYDVEFLASNYQLDFPLSGDGKKGNLSDGVYCYKIRAGSYTAAKQMVLKK
jgi:hypothetical protein